VKLPLVDRRDIRFTQLSISGKIQSEIRIITQDNYGFLFGLGPTLDSISYDGYSLKSYRHDPDDPNSLSDDTIRSLYKDRDGILDRQQLEDSTA
jgi:hypothetical protein